MMRSGDYERIINYDRPYTYTEKDPAETAPFHENVKFSGPRVNKIFHKND